jgi:hypothetical protein
MKFRLAGGVILAACVAFTALADEVKSGKKGGAFDVKAITGELKGKTLCYV